MELSLISSRYVLEPNCSALLNVKWNLQPNSLWPGKRPETLYGISKWTPEFNCTTTSCHPSHDETNMSWLHCPKPSECSLSPMSFLKNLNWYVAWDHMLLILNRQRRLSDSSETCLEFLLLKYPKCVGKTFPLGCYWDLSFQEDFQTCLVSARLIISLCGLWFFSFYSLSGILRYVWEQGKQKVTKYSQQQAGRLQNLQQTANFDWRIIFWLGTLVFGLWLTQELCSKKSSVLSFGI